MEYCFSTVGVLFQGNAPKVEGYRRPLLEGASTSVVAAVGVVQYRGIFLATMLSSRDRGDCTAPKQGIG